MKKFLYLTTGIDVVHIGVNDDFEHHAGMVGTTACSVIEFMELAQVKLVYYSRNDSYRVIFRDIFIYSLWKGWNCKNDNVPLSYMIILMSKDTNSFRHDKALACESQGFVYTNRGCIVLTHPLLFAYRIKSNFYSAAGASASVASVAGASSAAFAASASAAALANSAFF